LPTHVLSSPIVVGPRVLSSFVCCGPAQRRQGERVMHALRIHEFLDGDAQSALESLLVRCAASLARAARARRATALLDLNPRNPKSESEGHA